MMVDDFEFWSEAVGSLAVAVMVPFYMGIIHLTLVQLLAYGGVAGLLLAGGEHLRFAGFVRPALRDFLDDLLLWALMVLGIGTISYLVAVILI